MRVAEAKERFDGRYRRPKNKVVIDYCFQYKKCATYTEWDYGGVLRVVCVINHR